MEGLGKASGALSQEILRTYNNPLKEEDILDMLTQCEADERLNDRNFPKSKIVREPKSIRNIESIKKCVEFSDDDDDEYESESNEEANLLRNDSRRSRSECSGNRRKMIRPNSKLDISGRSTSEERFYCCDKQDEENMKKTLSALNEMHIKFPGKTDEEAELILDKVKNMLPLQISIHHIVFFQMNENWKFHKPRIASYWLVKLDSIKRRKVLDIVRGNVRALLAKVWKVPDLDGLRLNRIFCRVFSRLLWSHGQGLWNCFQTSSQSWEIIFSKSTDNISTIEMLCCRRIVQLCRDCLLIVYQFASESKSSSKVISPEPIQKQ